MILFIGIKFKLFIYIFILGDGAGVGKGRTIAGIIYENFLQDRKKAIWVSISNDLSIDAKRDLKDIGANGIKVHNLTKVCINLCLKF